jgi:hypothetical protein
VFHGYQNGIHTGCAATAKNTITLTAGNGALYSVLATYKRELINEFNPIRKSAEIHMTEDWIRSGEELVSKEIN